MLKPSARPPSTLRFTSVPTPCTAGARPSRIPVTVVTANGEQQHGGIDADVIRPRQHPLADQIERVGRQIREAECNGAADNRRAGGFRRGTVGSAWRVDAPSATRTAISRCRTAARASSRFARLAQVISRTKPTAPKQHEHGAADVAAYEQRRATARRRSPFPG